MKMKKAFLIFAFTSVSVIGLLYGASPQWFASFFLDISPLEPDIAHILRAIMGLYLGLGLFWLYAAFNDQYTKAAVLTTAIFAGGLVLGRIFSLLLEGRPASLLTFYTVVELMLTPLAIWVFKLEE